MHGLIYHVFAILLHLGALGLIILSILDSSFLFFPVGNDLLLIALVAQNHGDTPIYVAAASVGSAIGVLLLDLVTRKGGEEGLKKMMSPKRLKYLNNKMKARAGIAVATACLAPPPFPFTAMIAAASALQYPRLRLILVVFGARVVRFSLVAGAALWLHSDIVRIANSTAFQWLMGAFIAVCVVGSIVSILRWVRLSRSQPKRRPAH